MGGYPIRSPPCVYVSTNSGWIVFSFPVSSSEHTASPYIEESSFVCGQEETFVELCVNIVPQSFPFPIAQLLVVLCSLTIPGFYKTSPMSRYV